MIERRLVVLRHAKSSWNSDAESDHARPLNTRGRRDAPAVAAHLSAIGWCPELVICSDASRTTETWDRMRLAFGDSVPVLYSHGLYHAGMGEVREELVRIPDNVGTVMVVGHNPGWESVVCWLSAENVQMTTANAALLKGAGPSWELAIASPGGWSLDALIRPKEL